MSVERPDRTWAKRLLAAAIVGAAAVAGTAAWHLAPSAREWWPAAAAALAVASIVLTAFLSGGAANRRRAQELHMEWQSLRGVLAAIPDGLLVIRDGRICSVNRRLCELLAFERHELVGAGAPFPFWPPEHRHDLEAWHAALVHGGTAEGELTFVRRDGERLHVAVAGRSVEDEPGRPCHVVTVRDVSASRRRELRLAELCGRDPHTGLPDQAELERLLGGAVRHALAHSEHVSLVLAEVSVDGSTGRGVLGRPEAILAISLLEELIRADDVLARAGEAELALILPETDAHGAVGAVARARIALAAVPGVALTVGISDLATAGDVTTLYAFADRALVEARKQGAGGTSTYSVPHAA
jgi:PAS domain S-box-containing protein